MKFIFKILFLFFLCSCQTIRFVKTSRSLSNADQPMIHHQFHHIGLLGLYEYSDPVSIKNICEDREFLYVETKKGLLEYVISLAGTVIPLFKVFYTPMSVEIACNENSLYSRDIANYDSNDFKFKVIRIKNNKATIISNKKLPNLLESFYSRDRRVNIFAVRGKRAVIQSGNTNFKVGKIYQGNF